MSSRATVATFVVLVTACGQAAGGSDRDTEAIQQEPAYMLVEHWKCPARNVAILNQRADSIWTPIFDQLVAEGAFLAFGRIQPLDDDSEWNWMSYWMAESPTAMDSAWEEFGNRLRAIFPDDPRPNALCDTLMTRNYRIMHEVRTR